MKALALLSLILVVSCTADQYVLKCTRNEIGVLWPNYDDTTQYYQCTNVGQPVLLSCAPGNVFTFVYQTCTPQSEYIPAPPLKNLPTDAPTGSGTTPGGPTGSTAPPFTLPTPQTPNANATTTSASPTTKTTTPSTTKTTTSSTAKTTTSTTPKTTTGTPTPPTPPGGVPNPPSPPVTGIPMPATPAATPPVVDVSPPNAPSTVGSSQ